MNNEQQTWILRKPINVEFLDDVPGGRYVTDLEIMGRDDYMWNEAQFDEEHFKAQFVPLDVSGLTGQVEKQIHKAFIRGYEYGLKTDGEPSEDPTFDYEKLKTTIAEQVVLLLLGKQD